MVDVLRDLYSRPKIVITKNSWRIENLLTKKGILPCRNFLLFRQ